MAPKKDTGAAKRYKKRVAKGKPKYKKEKLSITHRGKKIPVGTGVTKTGKRRKTVVFSKLAPDFKSIATIGKKGVWSSRPGKAKRATKRAKKKK
jgi:hypothetical protein